MGKGQTRHVATHIVVPALEELVGRTRRVGNLVVLVEGRPLTRLRYSHLAITDLSFKDVDFGRSSSLEVAVGLLGTGVVIVWASAGGETLTSKEGESVGAVLLVEADGTTSLGCYGLAVDVRLVLERAYVARVVAVRPGALETGAVSSTAEVAHEPLRRA